MWRAFVANLTSFGAEIAEKTSFENLNFKNVQLFFEFSNTYTAVIHVGNTVEDLNPFFRIVIPSEARTA